jgi:hypothetical protein
MINGLYLMSIKGIVYKWGGIAFDDYSLAKILMLPTNTDDDPLYSFHDEAGSDYQVPAGHIFVAGKMFLGITPSPGASAVGKIGESDTPDAALTKDNLSFPIPEAAVDYSHYLDVLIVFAAGKYITAQTSAGAIYIVAGTALYGVEIDIS